MKRHIPPLVTAPAPPPRADVKRTHGVVVCRTQPSSKASHDAQALARGLLSICVTSRSRSTGDPQEKRDDASAPSVVFAIRVGLDSVDVRIVVRGGTSDGRVREAALAGPSGAAPSAFGRRRGSQRGARARMRAGLPVGDRDTSQGRRSRIPPFRHAGPHTRRRPLARVIPVSARHPATSIPAAPGSGTGTD